MEEEMWGHPSRVMLGETLRISVLQKHLDSLLNFLEI